MNDVQESVYAGLDRRVGAFFIDVLLVYLLIGLIQYAVVIVSGGFPFNSIDTGREYQVWFLLTVSLPLWLYFTLLESSPPGATPGKRLLKVRVVGLDGEGIRFGRALVRTVVKMLPWELVFVTVLLPDPLFLDPTVVARPAVFLLYFLLGLYLLAPILSPRKRSIHDWIARTLVVNTGIAPPGERS
ncbi:MAG: RDD family protein [Anaerolineales bacterium]|nr:RDD family protein [Anaerolineales bacterium]